MSLRSWPGERAEGPRERDAAALSRELWWACEPARLGRRSGSGVQRGAPGSGQQGDSDTYWPHGHRVGAVGAALGGGYLMACSPEECTVADVLDAAEGTLAPVACIACDTAVDCNRSDTCKTLPMWQRFDSLTRDFFGSVTIADLVNGQVGPIP